MSSVEGRSSVAERLGKHFAVRVPNVSVNEITIEQYLEKVSRFSDNEYGRVVRGQFADMEGASELGMLAAPSGDELCELKKAVAIMTRSEKENAHKLSDEQVERIASDARIDPANLAIFINGYALERKRGG
ncbi:MAG: hypothetical protein JW720_11900 [Sedimentisphaerales bacterium]|nr:hypothetical protein [Sedimentisphaerales bacterium]